MSLTIILGGLVIGLLVGLTGVGGAALVTPLLLLIGVPASTAVGTDLVYNTGTKLIGSIQHWRQKAVELRWVMVLAAGGIPAALIGGSLVGLIQNQPGPEKFLSHAIGGVLILASLITLVQILLPKKANQEQPAPPANPWSFAPLGALVGFLVGLTSIGSGSLIAPILLLWSRLSPRQVVGTDIANALLLSATAGLTHAFFGTVNYHLALNLLVGSIPGVLLGSRLTLYVPGKPLRAVMSGLVFFAGLRLL